MGIACMRLDQADRNVGREGAVVDGEHHFIADHLHHPTTTLRNVLVRNRLEAVDHHRQLVWVERLAHGGEAHQVGEANREGAIPRRGLRGQSPQRGQQVPSPDVAEKLFEVRGERLNPAHELGDSSLARHRLGASPFQPFGDCGYLRIGDARAGTAHLMPKDDPRARQQTLDSLNAAIVRLVGTELLTIRIDLEHTER